MKYIKYLFFLVLIAIIGIAIYIAILPSEFSITKTRTIKAPATVIYNNVNDYKNWESWLSWIEKSPEAKTKLSAVTKEEGASYIWEDNNKVTTIKTIETSTNKSISQTMQIEGNPKYNIDWIFKSNNNLETEVTWNITGTNLPFNFKAKNIFNGGIAKQIGLDYERSLERLDSSIISSMKKYSIIVDKETTQHSGGYYIYNTAATTFEGFQAKITTMLPEVLAFAKENNITMAGAPYVLYHKWDEENNAVMFSCCVPTTARVITTGNNILTGQLAPFKAVKTTLNGNYSNSREAWDKATKAITNSGLVQDENGPKLEAYLNMPINTPNPADLKTEIYIAVK